MNSQPGLRSSPHTREDRTQHAWHGAARRPAVDASGPGLARGRGVRWGGVGGVWRGAPSIPTIPLPGPPGWCCPATEEARQAETCGHLQESQFQHPRQVSRMDRRPPWGDSGEVGGTTREATGKCRGPVLPEYQMMHRSGDAGSAGKRENCYALTRAPPTQHFRNAMAAGAKSLRSSENA